MTGNDTRALWWGGADEAINGNNEHSLCNMIGGRESKEMMLWPQLASCSVSHNPLLDNDNDILKESQQTHTTLMDIFPFLSWYFIKWSRKIN